MQRTRSDVEQWQDTLAKGITNRKLKYLTILFFGSHIEKIHHTTIQNKLLAFKSENKNLLRHLQRTIAKESGGENSDKSYEERIFSRTKYHKTKSSSYI